MSEMAVQVVYWCKHQKVTRFFLLNGMVYDVVSPHCFGCKGSQMLIVKAPELVPIPLIAKHHEPQSVLFAQITEQPGEAPPGVFGG